MRICYIADQTSIHTQRWLRYFAKAGHEIFLIPHSSAHIEIDGINLLGSLPKLSYKSISFFSTLRKAKSIISEIKPDILHAHFVEQFGWLAALIDYHPFVLTAWGTDIYSLPYASTFGIGKKFSQYSLKKADMMTAISKDLKKKMVQLGARKNKINIIHWGVDLDKFKPDINISELKRKLNICNSPVILSNRIFETNSNIDVIINSFSLVLQKISGAILLLQNPGGRLQEDIELLIDDLGIRESVRILPQYIYSDMPALYALADIYVSVPSWDAACISLTEAMACGAVPVISEIRGPMEWVKENYNGRVVSVKNPSALAHAICDLIKNSEKRELFKNRNLDLISKRGDHHYWMAKMNDLYTDLHIKNKK